MTSLGLAGGARLRATKAGRRCSAVPYRHRDTQTGLAIQLSQGQGRQPLSPEGDFSRSVHGALYVLLVDYGA